MTQGTAEPTVLAATVLDFGPAAVDEEAVLARFDDLPPGLTLVVRSRAPLGAVREALRARRHGAFEWTPTLEGPWYWEVEVFRRDADPPVLRRVGEALAWDHDRLHALERRTFALQARGRTESALRLFARFAHGLRRHIHMEEQVVFPQLEKRLGDVSASMALARAEHREIERLLDEVGRRSGAAAPLPDGPVGALRALLQRHERDEESAFERTLELLLTDQESDALVSAVQSLGEAAPAAARP
jgi:uncharacterized protein (DUF2249 family)